MLTTSLLPLWQCNLEMFTESYRIYGLAYYLILPEFYLTLIISFCFHNKFSESFEQLYDQFYGLMLNRATKERQLKKEKKKREKKLKNNQNSKDNNKNNKNNKKTKNKSKTKDKNGIKEKADEIEENEQEKEHGFFELLDEKSVRKIGYFSIELILAMIVISGSYFFACMAGYRLYQVHKLRATW